MVLLCRLPARLLCFTLLFFFCCSLDVGVVRHSGREALCDGQGKRAGSPDLLWTLTSGSVMWTYSVVALRDMHSDLSVTTHVKRVPLKPQYVIEAHHKSMFKTCRAWPPQAASIIISSLPSLFPSACLLRFRLFFDTVSKTSAAERLIFGLSHSDTHAPLSVQAMPMVASSIEMQSPLTSDMYHNTRSPIWVFLI